jgi:hypothetical protein
VVEHAREQGGVAIGWHGLETVGEIAVVPVGAHGDAGGNRGVELRRVQAPLLAGVAAEELLVQLPTDAADDDFLAGADLGDRLSDGNQERLDVFFGERQAVVRVDRV